MTDIAVIDCTTGDVIVRPMTDDEQTRHASIIDTPGDVEPGNLAATLAAAEQARRDAYDQMLAGKTRTLALIDQATRAGSAAFTATLAP